MARTPSSGQDAARFDVAIVGSGVAGALIAWRLALAGLRVGLIEAGAAIDRAAGAARFRASLIQTPDSAYEEQPWAPWPRVSSKNEYYVQSGDPATDFQSTYLRAIGGTTWHWLGSMIRLLPSDFELRTRFGVGIDWPISYADLEPWYLDGERQLGVAGDDAYDLGSPRSAGYPQPPIPPTYSDRIFKARCEPLGLPVVPTPQARNSTEYEGRPPCCGNAQCIPICPIGAKYDASVHVGAAVARGVALLSELVAVAGEIDAVGNVARIRCRRPDRSEQTVEARVFVVACNAIETAKLLLMSRTGALPNGVANSSDQVGRNLADHPIKLSIATADQPVYPYRSPLATSGIESLRDGDFRSNRSAFRIEIGNDGWSWPGLDPLGLAREMIAGGRAGASLWNGVHDQTPTQIRGGSLCEQLPDPTHRVEPAWDDLDAIGGPRPRLTFGIDPYTRKGLDEAATVHDRIFDAMGATYRLHVGQWQGAGHLMGTHRMGTDPKTSVTDGFGRTHDHPNLFLAGAGLFPTTGTANPTATVAALALRSAAAIERDFNVSAPDATPVAAGSA
ncbi:MAG: GMC family oxidoreductase [Chloroflexota bacterium]